MLIILFQIFLHARNRQTMASIYVLIALCPGSYIKIPN